VALAVDDGIHAYYFRERNVFTRPFAFFQDFDGVDLRPHDDGPFDRAHLAGDFFVIDVEVFGYADIALRWPTAEPCRPPMTCPNPGQVRVLVLRSVFVVGHVLDDHAEFPVGLVRHDRVRIVVHGEGVDDRDDADLFAIRIRIIVCKFGEYAHRRLHARAQHLLEGHVPSYFCVRLDFDVPDDALQDLGYFFRAAIAGGIDLDGWALLTLVVRDLRTGWAHAVNGETRSAVALTLGFDLLIPLVHAIGEFEIVEAVGTAESFRVCCLFPARMRQGEELACICE
jgi:hypothetical protein